MLFSPARIIVGDVTRERIDSNVQIAFGIPRGDELVLLTIHHERLLASAIRNIFDIEFCLHGFRITQAAWESIPKIHFFEKNLPASRG